MIVNNFTSFRAILKALFKLLRRSASLSCFIGTVFLIREITFASTGISKRLPIARASTSAWLYPRFLCLTAYIGTGTSASGCRFLSTLPNLRTISAA